MKVVHVSTKWSSGGAAASMRSLHLGLLQAGIDSKVLSSEGGEILDGEFFADPFTNLRHLALGSYVDDARSSLSNTHFSLDAAGVSIADHPLVRSADIVHLHWVSNFLSSRSLWELGVAGKKICWTLHDIRPLSGGCHFPAGCRKWESGCDTCPQLERDPHHVTAHTASVLKEVAEAAQVHWIAPSRWLAEVARESFIGGNLSVNHIPYGVDSDVFKPMDRLRARQSLGLHDEVTYILLGSQSFIEKRKGLDRAREILDGLGSHPSWSEARKTGSLRLLSFGEQQVNFSNLEWHQDHLGYVSDRNRLAEIYSAANMLLFTSLEDNLPNVLLEAMACGLPIAALPVGGVTDLIEDGVNGICPISANSLEIAERIGTFLSKKTVLESWGKESVHRIREKYSLGCQASAHVHFYKKLISEKKVVSGSMPANCPAEGATKVVELVAAEYVNDPVGKIREETAFLMATCEERLELIHNLNDQIDVMKQQIKGKQRFLEECKRAPWKLFLGKWPNG